MKDLQKKAYLLFNRDNAEVTKAYFDIIKSALEKRGFICEYVSSLDGIGKKNIIIYLTSVDAFVGYLKGYKNFIVWEQGIVAEESYMRNKSLIKKNVLLFIERFATKKAMMVFFVSEHMKEYYEKLTKKSFDKNSYIMPCYNETLDTEVFEQKDYSKKTFTYTGSLSVWQCFDETAELFAKIEQAIPDAHLKVLAFNKELAKEILQKYGVKNYEVDCVPKEQVKNELIGTTYGFLLRNDIEVNRVATPTKISSYLAAGVIPIYSPCLTAFNKEAEGKSFAIPFNIGQSTDELIEALKKDIDPKKIQAEISELFDSYYSTPKHIERIAEKLQCLGL